MKKILFFLLAIPSLIYAEGPLFSHQDPIEQQEFENSYQDIRSKLAVNGGTGLFSDGSAAIPSISFAADQDTGFYRQGSNVIAMTVGGIRAMNMTIGAIGFDGIIIPNADNTYKCGQNGSRWSEIWATNGTIQTSSSKNKREVREIISSANGLSLINLNSNSLTKSTFTVENTLFLSVPRGIVFKWKSKEGKSDDKNIIGFVGDDLPEEAHAIKEDGSRDPENFYTSSVIGIMASNIRAQEVIIKDLTSRIENLEKK